MANFALTQADKALIDQAVKAAISQFPIEPEPELILSIIWQESKGDKDICRFEPEFYSKRIATKGRTELAGFVPFDLPTLATERVFRATSWGLVQILGETARVVGYKDKNLNKLVDPMENVYWGCRYLSFCITKATQEVGNGHGGNHSAVLTKALTRYNGAAIYADKIFSHMASGIYKQLLP